MSRIRWRDTQRELWKVGLRFRVNLHTETGRPDLVFLGKRVAIFIDGCFWHGCPEHYLRPRTRDRYWAAKLRMNVERDLRQTTAFEAQGWRVCRFWEHEVIEHLEDVVSAVRAALSDAGWHPRRSLRVVQVVALPGTNKEKRFLCHLRGRAATRVVVAERKSRMWSRAVAR
jgi:DNA mismatch endonuclease (patch repair protein)